MTQVLSVEIEVTSNWQSIESSVQEPEVELDECKPCDVVLWTFLVLDHLVILSHQWGLWLFSNGTVNSKEDITIVSGIVGVQELLGILFPVHFPIFIQEIG